MDIYVAQLCVNIFVCTFFYVEMVCRRMLLVLSVRVYDLRWFSTFAKAFFHHVTRSIHLFAGLYANVRRVLWWNSIYWESHFLCVYLIGRIVYMCDHPCAVWSIYVRRLCLIDKLLILQGDWMHNILCCKFAIYLIFVS